MLNYKTTKDIKLSEKLIDQVIGQDEAINIVKKAAKQKRHVLLIGSPGTGKSLIGQALAELLPKEKLQDILIVHNEQDDNNPLVKTMPRGQAKDLVNKLKIQSLSSAKNQNLLFFILLLASIFTPWWIRKEYGDIMAAASLIGSMIFLAAFVLFINLSKRMGSQKMYVPKLLVDNSNQKKAPFIDATGNQSGALLGDVLHDPLQSGGLGTPAYQRVCSGAIHKANGGVLFIDEVGTLDIRSQQELLTAMQEKKYSITGQSERSSGAMVKTESVPCNFVLAAAGNYDDLQKVHPA